MPTEYVQARLPALSRAAFRLSGEVHLAEDLVQQTLTAKWSAALLVSLRIPGPWAILTGHEPPLLSCA